MTGYVPSAEAIADTHWFTSLDGTHCVGCGWREFGYFEDISRGMRRHVAEVAAAAVPVEVARLQSRIESLSSDLAEAESDRDRHDEDHRKACVMIAEMFEAGTGVSGSGPKVGILEDLREVRRERDDACRLLGEVRALAESIERGTERFMENYLDDGKGISTRMSGEAAAMIVAERSQITADLRAVPDTAGVPAQVDEAARGGQSS